MPDLVDELESLITTDVLNQLGSDPSGELRKMSLADLLIIFANWRARFPSPIPRTVHRSAELEKNSAMAKYSSAIAEIEADLRSGNSVARFLSRGVESSYVPTGKRPTMSYPRRDLDGLMAEWGIHHFHLSTVLESDGFVRRTDDLLLVALRNEDAYFIDIYPHESRTWTDRDVIRIAVRNWPEAQIVSPLKGGLTIEHAYTDEEYRNLRNAGVTVLMEIDGVVYVPPGQTTAGTPLSATDYSNFTMHRLHALRRQLESDPTYLDDQLNKQGVDIRSGATWFPTICEGQYGVMGNVRDSPDGNYFFPVAACLP